MLMAIIMSMISTMAMLCTATSMTMSMTMTMTVSMEEQQSNQVHDQPCDANIEHPVLVINPIIIRQAFNRLNKDRETKSNKEYGINESPKDFGPCPAVGVFLRTQL